MRSSGRFSRPWWVETRRRRGYSTMATSRRSPVLQLSMLVCAVLATGCPGRDRNTTVSVATSAHTATAAMSATATAGDVSSPGQQAAVHDPAHPPNDCPLRKQGLDPAHLRPFEDTAKYIAFLERPDRAAWQKPDAVVAALGLTGKETIVDIGAGSGYFSFRLARAVPEGKVIAPDVEPEMIRHIHHKAMTEGVRNVQAAFAKPDDPGVPAEADLVFMCDAGGVGVLRSGRSDVDQEPMQAAAVRRLQESEFASDRLACASPHVCEPSGDAWGADQGRARTPRPSRHQDHHALRTPVASIATGRGRAT